MRRRGSVVAFLLFNVLVSAAAVYVALNLFGDQAGGGASPPQQIVITVPILITATPDPDAAEARVIIITATPLPGTPRVVELPTGLIDTAAIEATRLVANAPIDPQVVGADSRLQGTAAALPPGCILHTLAEGETPFGIAARYSANGFDLLVVNGLTEEDARFLQIGQVLIVPLEGCALTSDILQATESARLTPTVTPTPTGPTATPTFTPSISPTPSNTPTATLPPTAVNAQVEIIGVENPGALTAEGVSVRNNGQSVNLVGWTLRDGADAVFTFPETRLFTGGLVTVFSRTGTNTAIALFWGRDAAVWTPGTTITLSDARGIVQSTFRVE